MWSFIVAWGAYIFWGVVLVFTWFITWFIDGLETQKNRVFLFALTLAIVLFAGIAFFYDDTFWTHFFAFVVVIFTLLSSFFSTKPEAKKKVAVPGKNIKEDAINQLKHGLEKTPAVASQKKNALEVLEDVKKKTDENKKQPTVSEHITTDERMSDFKSRLEQLKKNKE